MIRQPASPLRDLVIRPESASEFGVISEVVSLAFGGRPQEVALVEAVRATTGYQPDLALVAVLGGRVVGHVMFTEVDVVGRHGESRTRVLDLAPLAVHPDHQRAGVGSRLVEAGLHIADERGDALVVVLGDLRYYGRFGFEPAATAGISPPTGVPAAAFGARRLKNYSTAVMGTVEFPPVFTTTGTL